MRYEHTVSEDQAQLPCAFDGVEGDHQIGGDGLVRPARGEHPKHLQCHANGVHAQRDRDGTFVPRLPRKIPPRRHVWLTPGTPGLPSVKRTETRTDRRTRMATLKTGSLETGAARTASSPPAAPTTRSEEHTSEFQ